MQTSASNHQPGGLDFTGRTVLFVVPAREAWPASNSTNISPGSQAGGESIELSSREMGELCFDFSTSYLTLQSSLWNTNITNFLFIQISDRREREKKDI